MVWEAGKWQRGLAGCFAPRRLQHVHHKKHAHGKLKIHMKPSLKLKGNFGHLAHKHKKHGLKIKIGGHHKHHGHGKLKLKLKLKVKKVLKYNKPMNFMHGTACSPLFKAAWAQLMPYLRM